MNIMFINSIAKKKFGGGEKWMITAAKGLSDRGHNIIVAGKKNSRFLGSAQKSGLNIKFFNIRGDFSLLNTIRISHFLKQNTINVLVCNLNKDVRVAGLAARFANNTVVIARHGVLLSGKKWKHKVTLTNLVDGILTNSESIKQIYQSYGWFRQNFVHVIYNGIGDKSDVISFDFSNQFPGKKIIVSAGRLVEQKGFSYLIEAAAQLKKYRDDLIFIIAGEGRLENQLKRMISRLQLEESFYFLGFIKDIDAYIKGCTLFVLPSLFEGMPNAVMEAMALGKPVISTDVNGVSELMENERTGRIIPSKNSEILAKTINALIDNNQILEEYGKNGLDRVKNNFTITLMISNLESYFLEKINEKQHS
jgi:glycosyltransferase involved in cell wall biosynthesis